MSRCQKVPPDKQSLRAKSSARQRSSAPRRSFIGSSDAWIIIGNDESALIRLWRGKRGEAEPHARHQFLSHALNDAYYDSRKIVRGKVGVLRDLLRRSAPEISMGDLERVLTATPRPIETCNHHGQETKKLLAMNRYERRALSRRNFAIRSFDVRGGANKSLMTTTIKKNSGPNT